MCGFAGVLEPDGGIPDREVLQRMGGVLVHRGPDDGGLALAGRCGLVHRRLSIIDLSRNGRQPMASEDGGVLLVCNGEIYNYRELRERHRLDDRGHVFRSRTDSEVLVHLYEEMGEDMLTELDGMFALAIWDRRRDRLILARDPFGIKPLFFARHRGALVFASEIKAILQLDGFAPEPDLEALHHFLSFDYIPGALTAFRGISELRPGTSISVTAPDMQVSRSFSRPAYDHDLTLTEDHAVERSRELLQAAVRRQLVSDVPVGVMLSGGMDSSALTALAARARGDSGFHTFALRFEDESFDESSFAEMVARSVGTSHHVIDVTADKVAGLLGTCISHIDEPYADGSAIPTLLLAGEASGLVSVLLSGEGGDEFFGGYDTHAALKIRRAYRCVPGILRRGVVRPLVDLLPVSHRKLSFEFKAKRFVRGAEMDVPGSHFFWRVVLAEEQKSGLMPPGSPSFPPSESLFRDAYLSAGATSDLDRILHIDRSYHLPDDLMIKNDRMTMAHSIEARVPFTDRALVEFLAAVPPALKLPGLRRKNLLRKAMKGILPDAVIRKKKVGLEMPYSSWMRSELREVVEEELSTARLSAAGLLRADGVRRLWDDHLAMRVDNGRALWGILNFMIWHRLYIASSGYRANLRIGTPVEDV
jgi:asparagine synthase (glutamine-hydrolysing)